MVDTYSWANSVRPIEVTCSTREPGHNSADDTSMLPLQLSGTLFIFICARHPSVEDNSELGWKPSSSTKPTVGAVVQLVEYRICNQEVAGSTHTQSTASNLKQVANLLCAQANSASYPQQDGKLAVAMWLIGGMACLLAAPWVQLSVGAGNGWPHNALRHHWLMPISCHFRHCKALLVTSLTHVSGAIASVQTFTFTPASENYLF